MKLLALDTSTTACSLGLSIEDKIALRHEIMPMQQTKHVLPLLHDLLKTENVTLRELDAIAVGCGPGSFTGVRIAISLAQGLAFAVQKPVIVISSLAAIAQQMHEEAGWNRIIVAIDARMNEVYWATYEIQPNQLVVLRGEERLDRPENIRLPDSTWQGAGNAWDVYPQQIAQKPTLINPNALPTAAAILALAQDKWEKGEIVAPEDALPVYLRDKVAKKMAEQ